MFWIFLSIFELLFWIKYELSYILPFVITCPSTQSSHHHSEIFWGFFAMLTSTIYHVAESLQVNFLGRNGFMVRCLCQSLVIDRPSLWCQHSACLVMFPSQKDNEVRWGTLQPSSAHVVQYQNIWPCSVGPIAFLCEPCGIRLQSWSMASYGQCFRSFAGIVSRCH